MATEQTTVLPTTMLTGCVKWFNNNLNYGFITVLTEGEHKNVDVFAHQSNIKTKQDCFRTLYTGECIQFELSKSNNDKHPFHAVNISGFNGTMLQCESNSNNRSTKPFTKHNDYERSDNDGYRGSGYRGRGSGGRGRGVGNSRGSGGRGRGVGSSQGGGSSRDSGSNDSTTKTA